MTWKDLDGEIEELRAENAKLRTIERAARKFMETASGTDADAYCALRDALESYPSEGPDEESK